jgi:hypothetical protein
MSRHVQVCGPTRLSSSPQDGSPYAAESVCVLITARLAARGPAAEPAEAASVMRDPTRSVIDLYLILRKAHMYLALLLPGLV